jgi:pteridine reductase
MTIEGKVALITGSAKRIGRAVGVELARRGARIAVHYRSERTEAEETLRMIRNAGSEGVIFCAELTDNAAVERMFEDIRKAFNVLDILINNASIFSPATADNTTPDLWDSQLDCNAKAPFFVAQNAARMMRKQGRGKIINIADVAGEVIWTGHLPYSISKAALIAVNRGLAKTYAPDIQVNAIAPGPILFPEYYSDEDKKSAIERTLLKREGSPQDVINAVVFLIENDYITGEMIHVDGGRHLL